ncbi:MAG: shikimate dehydrogenase [Acidimicrobiales bacterium]|nr:shikimate dehydrogenase [Acidimicrobiales bacterium]
MITGQTRLAGVIGFPIAHSLSPIFQNAAFEALGIDACSLAISLHEADLEDFLNVATKTNILGFSVTMPLKTKLASLISCSDRAKRLQAVNSLIWVDRDQVEVANDYQYISGDKALIGDNTDGEGFIRSIKEIGVDPNGLDVVVFGAGGAARAIISALGECKANSISIINRSPENAKCAVLLGGEIAHLGSIDDIAGASLIVNTTPIGMIGNDSSWSFGRDLINNSHVVVDIITSPLTTPLMNIATSNGAKAINGVGMLIHQGAVAIETWVGQIAPIDVMKKSVEKYFNQKLP